MSSELHDRRVRVARGVAAASVASLVALASHGAAGGAVPPLAVAAALVFSWPFGLLLIGRRPSLPRQTAVIVLAQAAMHLLATVATTSTAAMTVRGDGMAGMAGMATALPATAGMPAMTATPAMWAMHAAAAVITVAAWRHGEHVARAIADRIVLTIVRAAAVVAYTPTTPAPQTPASRSPMRRERASAAPARRRGPPLSVD